MRENEMQIMKWTEKSKVMKICRVQLKGRKMAKDFDVVVRFA